MATLRKSSHFLLWLPCVLYYLMITILSSVPGQNFGSVVIRPFAHFDKFVHFILYMFFGMILSRALSWEEYYHVLKKRWYFYFAMIFPAAALLDEAHQFFVPNRSMDVYDWLVDLVGGTVGALMYILVVRGRGQSREQRILENRDVRGFGLIVAMIYFMALVSLNIFDYKGTFFRNYSHLSFVLILAEFGLLGLLTIRFFYLRRQKVHFYSVDWLWLILAGAFFIALYQVTLLSLQNRYLPYDEIVWSLLCFVLGAVGYYIDKQIEKFRHAIWHDPLYKRKTWQRVYFFLPPFLLMMAIFYLSSKTPLQLYGSEIPMPQEIIDPEGLFAIFRNFFILHSIQFFIFGLFFYRAIAWESWWHQRRTQYALWFGSVLFLVLFAVCDEVLQHYVPGRVGDFWDVMTDISGGLCALVLYLFGYRVAKRKYFPPEESCAAQFEV